MNINTNAALITPRVAVQLAKVGLARLHIPINSADRAGRRPSCSAARTRVDAVWRGIHNVLVARELLGVHHPQISINCVMTRLNLFQFRGDAAAHPADPRPAASPWATTRPPTPRSATSGFT